MLDGDKQQALLLERLATIRPDLAFGQPCVMRSGTEADVLLFDTEVARFLRKPDLEKIKLEKEIADKVAGKGAFNVPVIGYLSEDGSLNIQNRVPGRALAPEDDKGGNPDTFKRSDLSDDEARAFAHGIAEFAAALHGSSRRGEIAHGALGTRLRSDLTAKQAVSEFLPVCPDEKLKASIAKLLDVEEDRREVIVHGDLWFGNVFFDRNNKEKPTGIIDFGRASLGSPSCDFGQMSAISPGIYREAIKHYNDISEEKIDLRQPLLYMAAIYTHAYVHCAEGPEKKPGDHQAQKDHAIMRLTQIAREYLPDDAPAATAAPLPKQA